MISFLQPWLWLGALALAAPIWLHLRRRRETNVMRFSAVQFLEDQPMARRSPLRLRDLILFSLRALAVLLAAGGFAWPFVHRATISPIRESRVYVLDNTMSHQANGGFLQDRDRVAKELKQASGDVQVAVVELTSAPRVVAAFGDDRQSALQKLEALRPSFQRGAYLAAFRQANALLEHSLGADKRIIFFGDNQENQWNENASTPAFLRNVKVDLPNRAGAPLPNLWLTEPRAQRIFLGDKSLINFGVKLNHTGPAKSANVSLRANGQLIFNRTVSLEQQPETIQLQAQWEAEPSSWLRGETAVEGAPDALAADNRVFFSLPPVVEGKVTLLAQSACLRLALSPEIMHGQWATRVLEPARLGEELNAGHDADVLLLESNYLQSSDARKLLGRYLSNGRGVILLVNRLTPAIQGYLRELGFDAHEIVNAGEQRGERFQFVFSNHPIFHPFLSPDYGNLMEIKVSQYARLKSSEAIPLVVSEKGDGLFFQGIKTRGKLFVMAFGLDREHTSWPVHQTFIPFLDLTLQAARAEDATPTTFEPGEVTTIQLPGILGSSNSQDPSQPSRVRQVVLRSETAQLARAAAEEDRAQLRLPDQPGLYAVTYDEDATVQKLISVNPSPRESQLTYIQAPQVLSTWQIEHPGKSPRAVAERHEAKLNLANAVQQRFWWWLLLGGVAALLIEMILAEQRSLADGVRSAGL
jgi:hypothetical protein